MKKCNTPLFHRLMALLLCCATVLAVMPMPARAENTAVISDIVVSAGITLPGYPGGSSAKVSKVMKYDRGNAVTGNGDNSYLTIVTGTTSSEFLAYRDTLKAAGYEPTMENEVASDTTGDPNRFASYLSPDGSYKVYTYHLPFYQETRIIVDTEANTVSGFNYVSKTGESAEVMLTMYGLSMSENGYDNTTTTEYSTDKRNCGALIVIRMPDNSLFIHDGGDLEQWSDEACDRFLEFCRELTGKKEGEKVVINTWFISHAHTDHYLGLPRFFSLHHDQLDLKYIMYNIDIERTYTTRDIRKVVSMVSSYYPEVKYYKPHTGETFNIAGIDFDVVYSHEDRYVPNANGDVITDYPTIENGKPVSAYDVGGTYRDFCYGDDGKSDFNDTSVVLRAHLDKDTDTLLYADMNRAEQRRRHGYTDCYRGGAYC